jgi:branched-chain amino acid transport system substrate-binding protein
MITQMKNNALVLLLASIVLMSGCAPKPIKIGLSVELTGVRGELGVMARDGAMLAVSEINESGGVNGRPLELIIKDDQGDPEIARQVDAELLEEGVVAVIGHITSGQTAAVIDLYNSAEIVLISGSAASSQFSNIDDYFLRTISGTDQIGSSMADYLNSQGVDNLTVIYDDMNAAFAVPFSSALLDGFEEFGHNTQESITFSSGESDLQDLVKDLDDNQTYMIVASGIDTGLIMQYSELAGNNSNFYTSSWASTPKLIEAGGQAVEGLELITAFDPDNSWPAYQPFVGRYHERYGSEPGLLAPKAYDTVYILAAALEGSDGNPQGLREALLQTTDFDGVEGLISLNEFGDAQIDLYIAQVTDGQITVIETIK